MNRNEDHQTGEYSIVSQDGYSRALYLGDELSKNCPRHRSIVKELLYCEVRAG